MSSPFEIFSIPPPIESPYYHQQPGNLSGATKAKSLPRIIIREGTACLCNTLSSLLRLGQLFGILPLVHDADHNAYGGSLMNSPLSSSPNEQLAAPDFGGRESTEKRECIYRFKFWSLPNGTNFFFFTLYTLSVLWCYLYYRATLINYFQGTDLYAHEFKVLTTIFGGSILKLFYRMRRQSFVKCIRILSSIWRTLDGVGLENLEAVPSGAPGARAANRWWTSPSFLAKATSFLICLNVFLATVVSTARFKASNSAYTSPGLYMLQVVTLSGLTALQQSTSLTFALLCHITKRLFIKLGRQLKAELRVHGKISGNRLEQIRLLHNSLCKSNRYLSDYFGLPVLTICCVGVISLTCGIYNFIFNEEDLFDNLDRELTMRKLFYVMFCFEMYFAVLGIGSVLVSGQLLSNSVSSCIEALHESNLGDLDAKSEFQVMVCLQSIKASSGKLTASNMTTIGMGFIASAVTNTTTYILVLLQFRLGTGTEPVEGHVGMDATSVPTASTLSY